VDAPAATTWDDRLFSFEVGANDNGERVRITVRRADTGKERCTDVPPEEFAAEAYPDVVGRHVAVLRAALGYVEPDAFGSEEFVINQYRCSDAGGAPHGACDVVHARTGRRSALIDYRSLGDIPARVAVERALEKLIRDLHADGVAPQPCPLLVARKKVGKPRREAQHAGGAVD